MTMLETIVYVSLYLLIGGVVLFVALVALPAAIRAIRTAWIHRSASNEVMEEQYNITYQAVKDQYGTKTVSTADVFAEDNNNY